MLRIAIVAGGVGGALARHAAAVLAGPAIVSPFPWVTLVVNVCGSWVLGALMGLLPATTVTPATRAGLTIGFCGGFTTFSTFAYEAVAFARQGQVREAAAYVSASLFLGVLAMLAGLAAGALMVRSRPMLGSTGAPRGAEKRP